MTEDAPTIARALGRLEGSFEEIRTQNRNQHLENRDSIRTTNDTLRELSDKVDGLVRTKYIGLGLVSGLGLAAGALGGKLTAVLNSILK